MRASFRKTLVVALILAVASTIAGVGAASLQIGWLACVVAAIVAIGFALLASAAWLASDRDRRLRAGKPDRFLAAVRYLDELQLGSLPAPSRVRRWLSSCLNGHDLMVGDVVRILSYDEIRRSLDASGCLEGLPFIEEMRAFCGQHARVFRIIDKVYDYGKSRRMRRLDGCVVLAGLFCDGRHHGNCEAECRLIWKASWLQRVKVSSAISIACVTPPPPVRPVIPLEPEKSFRCQYTELASASRRLSRWDIRKELRPLAAGNVNLRGFLVALLTRFFNLVQDLRRGEGYPQMDWARAKARTAESAGALEPGTLVTVRSMEEISRTLDERSKHRGLWFDRDMLKYCGGTYRVRAEVRRVIDSRTGRLRPMKTPCYTLEGVFYSGEFQSFNAQHEFLFWRSDWLIPLEVSSEGSESQVEQHVVQAASR